MPFIEAIGGRVSLESRRLPFLARSGTGRPEGAKRARRGAEDRCRGAECRYGGCLGPVRGGEGRDGGALSAGAAQGWLRCGAWIRP
nr:hypothetical protein StreXyl84_72950 [Streptomyces sp. Xyl84]